MADVQKKNCFLLSLIITALTTKGLWKTKWTEIHQAEHTNVTS